MIQKEILEEIQHDIYKEIRYQFRRISYSIRSLCSSFMSSLLSDLLVLSKACLSALKPSELSNQDFTSAALHADGSWTTGPRVIPSARTRPLAPPESYRERERDNII